MLPEVASSVSPPPFILPAGALSAVLLAQLGGTPASLAPVSAVLAWTTVAVPAVPALAGSSAVAVAETGVVWMLPPATPVIWDCAVPGGGEPARRSAPVVAARPVWGGCAFTPGPSESVDLAGPPLALAGWVPCALTSAA